jgi:hypothetical protein
MKKILLIVGMFFTMAAFAADKGTWTGYISDAHCGAKGNNDGHADCAKKCVKEGYAPVFVVGDKVYTISDPKKVSKYVGDKVTITGTITGDAIDIEKISK